MKRKLTILILIVLMLSSALWAADYNQLINVTPAGLRYDVIDGTGFDDYLYNAGVNYTGYFWVESGKTETASPAGPYVSTSGYVPKRYMAAEEAEAVEVKPSSFNALGFNIGVDANFDLDTVDTFFKDKDNRPDFFDVFDVQLSVGLALRQRLASSFYLYETVGASVGTMLVGGYADVGLAYALGHVALSLGARVDCGLNFPQITDFEFDDSSFVTYATPYVSLGVAF